MELRKVRPWKYYYYTSIIIIIDSLLWCVRNYSAQSFTRLNSFRIGKRAHSLKFDRFRVLSQSLDYTSTTVTSAFSAILSLMDVYLSNFILCRQLLEKRSKWRLKTFFCLCITYEILKYPSQSSEKWWEIYIEIRFTLTNDRQFHFQIFGLELISSKPKS